MRIKTVPKDFVVEEMADHSIGGGDWSLLRLKKRDLTTERALSLVAERLGIRRRDITCAGTKDRRAITTQYVTIRCCEDAVQRFSYDGVWLEYLGQVGEPLRLGDLEGNRFCIVVRGLRDEVPRQLAGVPNYFDEQRFSVANSEIGKSIILSEYGAACGLIVGSDRELGPVIRSHLHDNINDFVGALRRVPRHTLLMYVHAYQSILFNEVLTRYIGTPPLPGPVPISLPEPGLENLKVPMIGCTSELREPFASWYSEILDCEGITQRDFICKQIPFLTCEGSERDALVEVADLEIDDQAPDEIHGGGSKQTVRFSLPPGAYATIVLKCLYRSGEFSTGPSLPAP